MSYKYELTEQDRTRIFETSGIDARRIDEVRAGDHLAMAAPGSETQSILLGNLDGKMVVFFFERRGEVQHLIDARWSRQKGAKFSWAG